MLIVDDLEHEREEGDEDFVAVFQVEAHVERLHVGQVLEKVKVPAREIVLGISKRNIGKQMESLSHNQGWELGLLQSILIKPRLLASKQS